MKQLIILSIGAFAFMACKQTGSVVAPAVAKQPKDTTLDITYQADIRQIIDSYCTKCHTGNSYIKDLSAYDLLKARVDNGLLNEHLFVKNDMPPAGNPRPSDEELKKIKDWIDSGSKP